MDNGFVKAAEKSEIQPGALKAVNIQGKDVLLANVNGDFFAISLKCTHAGGDLSKGTLEGNVVTCPKHHAKFDVTNGKNVGPPKMGLFHPKANDATSYQVKIEQETVFIKP